MNRNEDDEVSLDLESDSEEVNEPATEPQPDAPDPAAEAFRQLEGQIALVRRAVEHLAAERADIVIPDYSTTLGQLVGQMKEIAENVGTLSRQPALTLTPAKIAEQIERGTETTRRQDHERLQFARQELQNSTQLLLGIVDHARTRTDQQRLVYKVGAVCLLAGAVLWSILPGAVARTVPASWRWPERMATRMLDQASIVEAGIFLIRSENPTQWDAIAEAARFERDNRERLAQCKENAEKAKAAVSCVVRIGP